MRDLDQLAQGRILRLDVLQEFRGVGLPVAIGLVLVADGLGATHCRGVQIGLTRRHTNWVIELSWCYCPCARAAT